MSELKINIKNGRMLKKNGSWMYCDQCNKTVGYLCYSTYQKFLFNFECSCGNIGSFELGYESDLPVKESDTDLKKIKNRLCCPNDDAPLFTVVDKNIKNVTYQIVCNKCMTEYKKIS